MHELGMPNVARLLRFHAPKKALPEGSAVIADLSGHPSDGRACSVVRFPTGVEAAWDGQTIRSLPRNWRSLVKWYPVEGANRV